MKKQNGEKAAGARRARKSGGPGRLGRRALRLGVKLLLAALFFTVLEVLVLRFLNPPFTMAMAWGWVRDLAGGAPYEVPVRRWRPLTKLSPHLKKAVLAGEDQRFLHHHGFDLVELHFAFRDLLRQRRVRGASTISMQAARTVFLFKERTWPRKLAEAYYTVLIELFWSKGRILEVYLNTVDWGPGVMGAEAASRRYFGISAEALGAAQAALLAAALPNPHRWSPGNPDGYLLERQRAILEQMGRMPYL